MAAGDLALVDRLSQTARALGIISAEFRVCQVYGTPLNAVVLREIGGSLRSLSRALLARADELDGVPPERRGLCARCGVEPVARVDAAASMVDGRFCADCIDRCLTDDRSDHWCPVDAFARATETQG
jgi:hypothetical protein